MPSVAPDLRVRLANDRDVDDGGEFVLYWMIAARRRRASFALQHAVARAQELGKPVVVLEALRCGYRWASDRLHAFVLQGMKDNAADFDSAGVCYHAYVEPEAGAGSGLLEALAAQACVVVTDEFPCFFLPRMLEAAAARAPGRLEVVDGNGLLPLRATDRVFHRAVDFRRALQKTLPEHLGERPRADPLRRLELRAAPKLAISSRWPAADLPKLLDGGIAELPLDHGVGAVSYAGGEKAALGRLRGFITNALARYGEEHHHPDADACSQLSPYLHFGHVSPHRVFDAVAREEGWSVEALGTRRAGQREGFWGMSKSSEAFLDELVTWRELSANFTHRVKDYDRYATLPEWSRKTLEKHAKDEREYVVSAERLEAADTDDEIWNAAQRELVSEGRIQGYLRMLWGKKVLQWSKTPAQALETLIHLNNKYAVDGRDPSSYSGIFWCFGRFDRPWGPERPIFGTVRYMTSDSTRRKLHLSRYLERWGSGQGSLF